ncbi:hypothetical protein PGQ11_013203 [Apiospora arundinis]|uniref:Uncharacterized protein n=1 Tax=Apiospora arundinis TaxID=335852 RepID=A0ABR2I4K4_9PEZI
MCAGRHPSDNGGNGNNNNNNSSSSSDNGSAAIAAWVIQTQTDGIFTLVKLKHKRLTVIAGNDAPSGQDAADDNEGIFTLVKSPYSPVD